MKVNIEGAEELVLDENKDAWLHLVDLQILEVHGKRNEKKARPTLERNGLGMSHYRTSWYCRRF